MKARIAIDRAAIAELCRRWKIVELSLFGSVLRDDFRPDSDIDVLYVFAPDAHVGWEIVRVEEELSALLGRKVDLVSKAWLNRHVRDLVLAEAEVVYAA